MGECIGWISRGVCAKPGMLSVFMSDVEEGKVNVLFRQHSAKRSHAGGHD